MQYFRVAALALGVAAGSAFWASGVRAAPEPATDLGLPVNVAAAMRSDSTSRSSTGKGVRPAPAT